jgi:hypothetical protein
MPTTSTSTAAAQRSASGAARTAAPGDATCRHSRRNPGCRVRAGHHRLECAEHVRRPNEELRRDHLPQRAEHVTLLDDTASGECCQAAHDVLHTGLNASCSPWPSLAGAVRAHDQMLADRSQRPRVRLDGSATLIDLVASRWSSSIQKYLLGGEWGLNPRLKIPRWNPGEPRAHRRAQPGSVSSAANPLAYVCTSLTHTVRSVAATRPGSGPPACQ